jgi:hypothetical protein
MRLTVIAADLFARRADALIVPIDGAVHSTLHHTDAHDDSSKRALVRRSFSAAIECAARASARSVLTAVLQGGWRMSAPEAFAAMLSALDERAPLDSITVCCLEEELSVTLRAHAASVGW